MITTTDRYDADLADARALIEDRIPQAGFPEGERDKAISDALNNAWSEGVELEEWVGAAAAMLRA